MVICCFSVCPQRSFVDTFSRLKAITHVHIPDNLRKECVVSQIGCSMKNIHRKLQIQISLLTHMQLFRNMSMEALIIIRYELNMLPPLVKWAFNSSMKTKLQCVLLRSGLAEYAVKTGAPQKFTIRIVLSRSCTRFLSAYFNHLNTILLQMVHSDNQ